MNAGFLISSLFAVLLLPVSGCQDSKHLAQPGDHVQADFTCRLDDGSLVEASLASIAGEENTAKSPIFSLRDTYQPFAFKVPETPETLRNKPFDPLEQKIGVAIANRIKDLPLEQTTLLKLQSSQIEHFPAGDRYLNMAMKIIQPRTMDMPLQEFEARYGEKTARVVGSTVGTEGDYPGIIRAVNENTITIHYSARTGAKMPSALTSAFVRELDDENFEFTMDVHVGQLIQRIGGLPGRVTVVDDEKFTVDFGQSFAGKTLNCEVTPRLFDPEKAKKQSAINWIEDFDEGLKLARQQGKPVVLFLYSDGCPYCHQMENKVFPDPSLVEFRNSFVWLKINSEKQTEYGEQFKQQGYPLTLILNAVGGEQERFSGLQHVTTLASKFDHILSPRTKG